MHILRSNKENMIPQLRSDIWEKDSAESIRMRVVGGIVGWRNLGKLISDSSIGLKW